MTTGARSAKSEQEPRTVSPGWAPLSVRAPPREAGHLGMSRGRPGWGAREVWGRGHESSVSTCHVKHCWRRRQALEKQEMLDLVSRRLTVWLGDGMGPLRSRGQELVSEEARAVGLFLQLVFIKPG